MADQEQISRLLHNTALRMFVQSMYQREQVRAYMDDESCWDTLEGLVDVDQFVEDLHETYKKMKRDGDLHDVQS